MTDERGFTARDYLDSRGDSLVASLTGQTKVGKTSLFWTYPGPHYIIDLDLGCDQSLERAIRLGLVDEKAVRVFPHLIADDIMLIPLKALAQDPGLNDTEANQAFEREAVAQYLHARELYDKVVDDYYYVIERAEAEGGSVCVDPMSKLWNLLTAVKLYEGEVLRARKWRRERKGLEDSDRRDYGLANATMEGLLLRAMACNKASFLFTQKGAVEFGADGKEKVEMIDGKPVPLFRSTGYRGTGDVVQAALTMKYDEDGEPITRIDASRFNRDVQGNPVYAPSYATIKTALRSA